MATFSFTIEWDAATEKTKTEITKVMTEACTDLFNNIINDTPVDTGRLIGNWQTTLEGSPDGETGDIDPSGSTSRNRVIAGLGPYKIDQDIYFTNNAPYAEAIEYGHSLNKAPNGMVRINLVSFDTILQSYAEKNYNGRS